MALLCLLYRRNYAGNLPVSAPYQRPRLPSCTRPFSPCLPSPLRRLHQQRKHICRSSPFTHQLPTHPSRPVTSQPVSLNKSHLSPSVYHLLTLRFCISGFINCICTGFKGPEVLLELLPSIPSCLLPLDPCSPRSAVVSFDH